ncbi:hypothetical protein COMNV_00695 [Commensalibacter sp. Nvir]|uniref:MYG1 family protein n=1 Tax=Commensalibacter sp. Nvir TaxID=3069817 RepID=UPI002D364EF4|nr:hypothetical protein COMNV_00695 [Commensalibacter sp. Nvir]
MVNATTVSSDSLTEGLMDYSKELLIVTHNGRFHIDDVFAFTTLGIALDLENRPFKVERTRDPEIIDKADIVFDVGGIFDGKRHFDHHQIGAPERDIKQTPKNIEGTIPYSSAGLIWQAFGIDVIKKLAPDLDEKSIKVAHSVIEKALVIPIDAIDNGKMQPENGLNFSSIINVFNPPWDEDNSSTQLKRFFEASTVIKTILVYQLNVEFARVRAIDCCKEAYKNSPDNRILMLPRWMPHIYPIFANGWNTQLVVYPAENEWRVGTVPIRMHGNDRRKLFPATWGGLEGKALEVETGVEGAKFVHKGLFIAVTTTKEAAIALARLTLGN